ncbi:MAG: DUF413 domain-containing protein [Pseudomonadales bacterium]|uniref:Macrodomain Ori protein n=1 Tax=Oleiphilus messinensis TaxID=141451 RepID=A0A1Y0I383_9GAMM|nr:DUF413 domain-containing protein [Oleiphilus messinensis]ARU54720.1 hypothetical protein OLMES_0617 [Oleiphilus messinensis]MCG8611256.1 DUF413 domain-containing protein [Pseudomonadales bacterium]
MTSQSFVSGKKFFDNIHFPRGFKRSGLFSIREAELLSETGVTLSQLADGSLLPENDEQRDMVRVMMGEKPAETLLEKTWSKYSRHISTRRCPLSLSMNAVDRGSSYTGGDDSFADL